MEKRRAHGAGTVYQRKSDGRWVAAVTIDGKRRSFYRHSEEDAWQVIAAYQRQRVLHDQLVVARKTASITFFE